MNLNLPNSSISKEELDSIKSTISSNSANITSLTNTYNSGISKITTKVTQCGVSTASNASPDTIVNNIGSVYVNRYNQGINDGRVGYYTQTQYNNWGNQKYNEGIAAGRVGYYSQAQYDNWGSTRYNQGVTDADNRANSNSVNYQTGYNNGVNAGKNDASTIKGIENARNNNGSTRMRGKIGLYVDNISNPTRVGAALIKKSDGEFYIAKLTGQSLQYVLGYSGNIYELIYSGTPHLVYLGD